MRKHNQRPRKRNESRRARLLQQPLRLAGFTVVLFLLLSVFHLFTQGVPRPLIEKLTEHLRERGIPTEIDSLRIGVRGWTLGDVRVYSTSPDDVLPILSAEKISFTAWPRNWSDPTKPRWKISLFAKHCTLSPTANLKPFVHENNPLLQIPEFRAKLFLGKRQLLLLKSNIQWGDANLQAAGTVDLPTRPAPEHRFDLRTWTPPPQLLATLQALADLQFSGEPEIELQFHLNCDTPLYSGAELVFQGKEILNGQRPLGQFDLHADYTNQTIRIRQASLARADGTALRLNGSYEPVTNIAQLTLRNTLSSSDVLNLLPRGIIDALDKTEINPLGPAVFTASAGPAPVQELKDLIRVDIDNLPIQRKDLTLAPLSFTLTLDGNQLSATHIETLANGGPLTGSYQLDLDSNSWSLDAQGHVHPGPIGTITTTDIKKCIDRFEFEKGLPSIDCHLEYDALERKIDMTTALSGTNVLCAGIALDSVETTLTYADHYFVLEGLKAFRGTNSLQGQVDIDFTHDLAHLNVVSTLPPRFISQTLMPDTPTLLDRFTFSGPILNQIKGQVDYGAQTNHLFDASVQIGTLESDFVTVEDVSSELHAKGTELFVTNCTMTLCEGTVSGTATVDLKLNDETAPYSLSGSLTDVQLFQLLKQVSTNDHPRTKGTLSGDFEVKADSNQPFWESAKGSGTIEIQDSHLASIPLFDSLTGVIKSVIPGFNLFSITTLTASYTLEDQRLRSDDIMFGGSLVSAGAKGFYSPETGLNFTLRLAPLRKNRGDIKWYQIHLWGAEAIQITTSPLFDLLELKVEGPLDDPTWRFIALPHDILKFIRRDKTPDSEETPSEEI